MQVGKARAGRGRRGIQCKFDVRADAETGQRIAGHGWVLPGQADRQVNAGFTTQGKGNWRKLYRLGSGADHHENTMLAPAAIHEHCLLLFLEGRYETEGQKGVSQFLRVQGNL